MRRIFIYILVIALAAILYKDYYKGKGKTSFNPGAVINYVKKHVAKIRTAGGDMIAKVTQAAKADKKGLTLESAKESIKKVDLPKEEEPKAVVIHMKHGGIMKAKLLEKTDRSYTVLWEGEKYTLTSGQVKTIEYPDKLNVDWEHKNDVVIMKKNGL